MRQRFFGMVFVALFVCMTFSALPAQAADNFVVDNVHSSITFDILHYGLIPISGRFNEFNGSVSLDAADPSKNTFAMNIKATSVDTVNNGRNDHLRSPDFFNVKQFPMITFKSTAVKKVGNDFEVTGDITLHGVTKSVVVTMTGGKTVNVKGGVRTGFLTKFVLKRSEYGITGFPEMLGDDVNVTVAFEAVKK